MFSGQSVYVLRLLRDHRVPIRAKLMALGIGAACIGVLELLQLPLEAVLAGILPLIGITGDIAFDGAEAVVGPVIIATMLLPYLVPPLLVRQIRAEGEREVRGLNFGRRRERQVELLGDNRLNLGLEKAVIA